MYCITFSSHFINDLEVAAGGGSVVSCAGKGSVWKQPSVGDSLGHVQTPEQGLSQTCLALFLGYEEEESAECTGGKQDLTELSQQSSGHKGRPRVFSDTHRWEVKKENV